tara:strand:+ start:3243 stop:3884 length:642 start_codon:yes stop_codon:yes gene_type:complete
MHKFKFMDIEQNSDEWFNLRAGRITSSKLGTIMANYGKAFGVAAKKYAVNLAIEQITGKAIPSSYSNAHMERGHEQEPIARALYEDEYFCEVTNGGFFESEFIGCSPDGLVDGDGVIEIKSVIASVHYDTIKRGGFDPAYKWQFIGNLYFTGRDWIDFVSYCEQFPKGKQLYTYRLNKKDYIKEFKMIDERTQSFLELIKETKETIINSNYIY